jgi:hypothetical protein
MHDIVGIGSATRDGLLYDELGNIRAFERILIRKPIQMNHILELAQSCLKIHKDQEQT